MDGPNCEVLSGACYRACVILAADVDPLNDGKALLNHLTYYKTVLT